MTSPGSRNQALERGKVVPRPGDVVPAPKVEPAQLRQIFPKRLLKRGEGLYKRCGVLLA